MRKFLYLFLILIPFEVFAVTEKHVAGNLTQILTHTNSRNPYDATKLGVVFLYVGNLPGACESNSKRVAISSEHPLFDTVTSIALSAQAQKKTVLIGYLETCTLNSKAWDFSYIRMYE
ncbi:hypothetical protein AADZ84_17455 [Colwelliaceae bacterium MEBiC 14330]